MLHVHLSNHTFERSFFESEGQFTKFKTFYLQEDQDRVFVSLLANLMVGPL